MFMLLSFPKDKEEIERRKMEIMLQKLKKTGDQKLSGRDGEKRLKEINQELTSYYKHNRALETQNAQRKAIQSHRSDYYSEQQDFLDENDNIDHIKRNASINTHFKQIKPLKQQINT